MQTLLDKIDHIDMLISSEYDLDEMVREFIPSPAGEEKVKRIYWVYHGLDHEGTSHIEEISKEEYEANIIMILNLIKMNGSIILINIVIVLVLLLSILLSILFWIL